LRSAIALDILDRTVFVPRRPPGRNEKARGRTFLVAYVNMPRLLIHFPRFGPYHYARLRAAADVLVPLGWDVMGLETSGKDATYAWVPSLRGNGRPQISTAFPGRVHENLGSAELRRVIFPLLDSLKPDVMAIAGWGSRDAQGCLAWCRKNDVYRIVMSETRAADGRRVWWKELLKRYLISRFNAGLVGGRSHRDYLLGLGIAAEKIQFGYNVVDNQYFAEESQKHRSKDVERTIPYFLASNRFIIRKNLSKLIVAYSAYVTSRMHDVLNSHPSGGAQGEGEGEVPNTIGDRRPWNLCLLGDGDLKESLISQCLELGLDVIESAPWEVVAEKHQTEHAPPEFESFGAATGLVVRRDPVRDAASKNAGFPTAAVFFPGFRQIEELPRFYAHAGCFVHPALDEPWGLVINEAMACGLPVVSSSNVGAAEELVEIGANGWQFEPSNTAELQSCLERVSAPSFLTAAYAEASRRIVQAKAPLSAFGEGLRAALQDCSCARTGNKLPAIPLTEVG